LRAETELRLQQTIATTTVDASVTKTKMLEIMTTVTSERDRFLVRTMSTRRFSDVRRRTGDDPADADGGDKVAADVDERTEPPAVPRRVITITHAQNVFAQSAFKFDSRGSYVSSMWRRT